MRLGSLSLSPLCFATTALALECKDTRCCQCITFGQYDNGQTQCVYDQVGAKAWGDNGSGLFFCHVDVPQSRIAQLCRGKGEVCNTPQWRGYDCWDCV
jgi:hypothetical protein